jgi:hypothetical protein
VKVSIEDLLRFRKSFEDEFASNEIYMRKLDDPPEIAYWQVLQDAITWAIARIDADIEADRKANP